MQTQNRKMAISLLAYVRDINKTLELGGGIVSEEERARLIHLVKKVKQHEETITQLVEIIAATNRRITDVSIKQKESENSYLLS